MSDQIKPSNDSPSKPVNQEKTVNLDSNASHANKTAGSSEKEEKITDKLITVKESEQKRLIDEAAKYKDQYLRLLAEFDNARKRMDRERQEFIKYANEGLMVEFLDILDNLERSVVAAEEKHQDYNAFLKGIEMVMVHIGQMLKRNGVKPIEAKGKKFDPHFHEVLMQEENAEQEEGTVLEEFQKGYMIGDRVLRTVKVKVAKSSKSKS